MESLETLEHRLPVVQRRVGDVHFDIRVLHHLALVPRTVLESKLHVAVDCGICKKTRHRRTKYTWEDCEELRTWEEL